MANAAPCVCSSRAGLQPIVGIPVRELEGCVAIAFPLERRVRRDARRAGPLDGEAADRVQLARRVRGRHRRIAAEDHVAKLTGPDVDGGVLAAVHGVERWVVGEPLGIEAVVPGHGHQRLLVLHVDAGCEARDHVAFRAVWRHEDVVVDDGRECDRGRDLERSLPIRVTRDEERADGQRHDQALEAQSPCAASAARPRPSVWERHMVDAGTTSVPSTSTAMLRCSRLTETTSNPSRGFDCTSTPSTPFNGPSVMRTCCPSRR